MTERDAYEPGVPCWVACVQPEPEHAVRFYTELFGWEAKDLMPPDATGSYFLCTLRGRPVAAVVSPDGAPAPPTPIWSTFVRVESADDAAERVRSAGGTIVGEPFDSPGGGRMAVAADTSGAVFCVWEPRELSGAHVVNEPGAWSMSQLITRDVEGATAFYRAVFGWEAEAFLMLSLFRLPGYVGGVPQQPVPRDVVSVMAEMDDRFAPDEEPHWSVDFWVHDVDAIAERTVDLGGSVLVPPHDLPWFREAALVDPFGAPFTVSNRAPRDVGRKPGD